MNPEQNNPLQPQDNQQSYQNPSTFQTPPQTFGPEQTAVPPQPQNPYLPPKQKSKLLPVLVGGVIVVLGIVVGLVLLLSGEDNSQSRNPSDQPDNKQSSSLPQENESALEEVNESEISAQNDTKHKNNLAKLVTAVSQYAANNNGKLPTAAQINSAFISQYLSGQFNDPNTNNQYKIVEISPKSGEVQYKTSSNCGSDKSIIAGSSRQVAARVLLSDSTYYCTTN